MNLGKKIRLERLLNKDTGRTLIVPLDHGVTLGAVKGIECMEEAIADVVKGGANAVLMHKGFLQDPNCFSGQHAGLIMHLSASTALSPQNDRKVLVGSVEEALRNGCDCVSIHVNIGDPNDYQMLSDMGRVGEECERWGMPMLAMMYARGPQITDSYAPEVIAQCARIGQELGADIVKVSSPGSADGFAEVMRSCSIPVVIAGGVPADSIYDFLKDVRDSILAGGSGVSVGRTVFQHPERVALTQALHSIIHKNSSVETALQHIQDIAI